MADTCQILDEDGGGCSNPATRGILHRPERMCEECLRGLIDEGKLDEEATFELADNQKAKP
jgi:hypothetical protein